MLADYVISQPYLSLSRDSLRVPFCPTRDLKMQVTTLIFPGCCRNFRPNFIEKVVYIGFPEYTPMTIAYLHPLSFEINFKNGNDGREGGTGTLNTD